MLEPVEDDGAAPHLEADQTSLGSRIGRFAIFAMIGVAVIWGIFALAPGPSGPVKTERDDLSIVQADSNPLVVEDPNSIIAHVLIPSQSGAAIEMARDKGCQRLSSNEFNTIHWVNEAGEKVNSVSPTFPGNWQLFEACPGRLSGTLFANLLGDGVAISQVDPNGATDWTQVVSVSEPSAEHVKLLVDDGLVLLVFHDSQFGHVHVSAFDENGFETWKQVVSSGTMIENLHAAKTGLGDLLVAWREPDAEMRLVIVSLTGFVLADTAIADRGSPLKDLVQNEFGETLVLRGEDAIEIELITRTSETVWQRSLNVSAKPIGLLSYETGFFVFAAAGERLVIWGIDQFGRVSSGMDIFLSEPLQNGYVQFMNPFEAILSVESENAAPAELYLDLRRLKASLNYQGSAPEAAPIPDEEISSEEAPQRTSINTDPGEIVELSVPPAPDIDTAAQIGSDDPVPSRTTERPTASAPSGTSEISAAARPVMERDQDTAIAPVNLTRARCTFSCVSTDEAETEYMLMQSVDVDEGETLADVSLRLNAAHVDLCRVSGGEPVSAFTRECRPE